MSLSSEKSVSGAPDELQKKRDQEFEELRKKRDQEFEKWKNFAALSTVILAVCATLATFKSAGYSTKTLLAQGELNDSWAFYQAKSIKQNLYEVERETVEIVASASSEQGDNAKKKLALFDKKIAKYDAEKNELKGKAQQAEKNRDLFQKHWSAYGMAVVSLQLAILVSSVSVLMKIRWLWLLSIGLGIIGLMSFLNGAYLFLPF